MAFGRRSRPSLLGTAARTAVIAGTATATSNAVNAKAAAAQSAQHQAIQFTPRPLSTETPAAMATVAPATAGEDILDKLERLAALHASGALTDTEFTQLKSTIIN